MKNDLERLERMMKEGRHVTDHDAENLIKEIRELRDLVERRKVDDKFAEDILKELEFHG